MRCRVWILLLGLSLPIVGRLAAQDGAGRLQAVLTHPGVHLSGMSLRIRRGTPVRLGVVGGGGPRISGRYVGMVGDTLLLDASTTSGEPVVFDSLWTRHRPIVLNAFRGAIVGAVVGCTYRLIRSARVSCKSSFASYYYPWPDCRGTVGNIGRGAVTGALVGAAARVALGEVFPKWKRHFP